MLQQRKQTALCVQRFIGESDDHRGRIRCEIQCDLLETVQSRRDARYSKNHRRGHEEGRSPGHDVMTEGKGEGTIIFFSTESQRGHSGISATNGPFICLYVFSTFFDFFPNS